MALTADEWAVARSWIGSKETDDVFEERFSRLGDLGLAIRESMVAQLTAMIFNRDASVQLDDGTAVNSAANIKALQDLLSEWDASGGLAAEDVALGARTTKLVRTRYR